ncbi:MAG: hypothetical protein IH845_04815 [Nanoarchaeota archaeon]|nr:hypothetical protein [Nanoarchaeota archaeon]
MIRDANKFGNRGLKKQQGTTRIIYDSLANDGRTEFRFFEGIGTRVFPFTNLTENKLSVGEMMTIERIYLMVFTSIAGVPSALNTIEASPGLNGATFEFSQANVDIIKPIAVASFLAEFNKDARHANYTNFEMDTQLVIQPLLEFSAIVRASSSETVANQFVRLVIEGAGAILAPRNTF